MALTYAMGGDPTKKKKIKKQQPSPSAQGKSSRAARAAAFTPSQNKEVAKTMIRNADVETAVKKKLGTLGEYGQWKGVEETKAMRKKRRENSIVPKFRR